MLNNNIKAQAPLFYAPTPSSSKVSASSKIKSWLTQWRIEQLQARIEKIQDALEYELRQNHSNKRLRELTSHAQTMCCDVGYSVQNARLLYRVQV